MKLSKKCDYDNVKVKTIKYCYTSVTPSYQYYISVN